jgi:hypothetical protein
MEIMIFGSQGSHVQTQRTSLIKMNFTERPTLLKNDPGNIRQNPMRCNSFELSAGDVTV